jgi:hypothetical protein
MNNNRDWSTFDNPTEPKPDTRDQLIADARAFETAPVDDPNVPGCLTCKFARKHEPNPSMMYCDTCIYNPDRRSDTDENNYMPVPVPASEDLAIDAAIVKAVDNVIIGNSSTAIAWALIAIAKSLQKG